MDNIHKCAIGLIAAVAVAALVISLVSLTKKDDECEEAPVNRGPAKAHGGRTSEASSASSTSPPTPGKRPTPFKVQSREGKCPYSGMMMSKKKGPKGGPSMISAKSESAPGKPCKEKIYYLCQKDFENGCVYIVGPGKYVLTEHIVCEFFHETQLTPDGYITPDFTGNANSARASVGIGICCNDVEIDGNGYSISQSGEGATQVRVFSAIVCSGDARLKQEINQIDDFATKQECLAYYANNNFKFGGGGPSDEWANFFEIDIGNENIYIHDLTTGRSSHFGIHATNTRNLRIARCNFLEFEVAACWINGGSLTTIEDVNIVGMQRFEQTLSQIWAFRAQGTGLKGVVNASYWGIILNQQQGGVNVIFPHPSGGTLSAVDSGGGNDIPRGELPQEYVTQGGINKQGVGAQGPILKNIRISTLKSQMINGYCLARETKQGNTVPILFDAQPDSDVGGGGHRGYQAKYAVQLEAIRDGYAWYPNVVSYLFYKEDISRFNMNPSQLNAWISSAEVRDENGNAVIPTTLSPGPASLFESQSLMDRLPKWTLWVNGSQVTGNDVCENIRLADRAFYWKDSNASSEGKPLWNKEHVGFKQYRGHYADGALVTDVDKFLFNFSNLYRSGLSTPINAPYPASQVTCHSAKATNGRAWYYDQKQADGYNVSGWRASAVLSIIGGMLNKHAGENVIDASSVDFKSIQTPVMPTQWWDTRNDTVQTNPFIPIDFGGHQMNGVVSIHCDRVWGGIFEDIEVSNAVNLRHERFNQTFDPSVPVDNFAARQTTGDAWDLGQMRGYTSEIATVRTERNLAPFGAFQDSAALGFAGSAWSLMINDSGGNILRRVNSLNMLARIGASFGIHIAFGSRGNHVEDCKVLSNTGGEMWGFVTDKGGSANVFKNCTAQDIVGRIASAGFVVRGAGNHLIDCLAQGVKVIAPYNTDFGYLDPSRKVCAGFLMDFGGAEEYEFNTRYLGSNSFLRCKALGVLGQGELNVDRNLEVIYRRSNRFLNLSSADQAYLNQAKQAAMHTTVAGFLNISQTNNCFEDCLVKFVRGWNASITSGVAYFEGVDLTPTSIPTTGAQIDVQDVQAYTGYNPAGGERFLFSS